MIVKRLMIWLGLIVLVLLGGCLFIYGGYDDSPGAQGLGLIVVIIGIVMSVKKVRKRKKSL